MNSATTTAAVAGTTVENAISALLKWKESQSQNQKLKLIPDDEFIYLILTLKKIPAKPRTNAYKIPLPHPLHSSAEICLIVDDRAAAKPSSDTVKEIIRAQNLPIAKVIKLSKLKTNYKPFEAKRKLCDSYDLFLVDKRVVHFLPKLIGKSFFKKKKIPIPVDMGKNWKGKVEKAVSSGLLYFRTGTCCVMKVGKGGMERGEIEENVVDAIEGVVSFVPKKWGGVRSLHLKFADSVALPLYQALPDLKLKIEGVRKEVEESEGEVESLKGDGLGSDRKNVGRKKEKGRIHEVRYMDVGLIGEELVSQDSDGDAKNVSADEAEDEISLKKEDVEDELNVDESDDATPKKMKKGKGVKRQAVASGDVMEPAKKGRKVQKVEGDKPKKTKGVVEDESNGNESNDATLQKTKKGKGVNIQVVPSGDGGEPSKKSKNSQKLEVDNLKNVLNGSDSKKGKKRNDVVVKAKEGSAISKEKRSKKRV